MNCDSGTSGGDCDNSNVQILGCRQSYIRSRNREGDSKSRRRKRKLSLQRIMSVRFDPLIHRMIDKHGWSEEEAGECFEEIKRFLYLGQVCGRPLSPPPKIDEIWHNWILFTEDYINFCRKYFGRIIHHRPHRRGEKVGRGGTLKVTLKLARKAFGKISPQWTLPSGKSSDS